MANLKNLTISGDIEVSGNMSISGTGGFRIATGTTAQRPSTPENGMIRYNTDIDSFEGYQAGEWKLIGGGSSFPVGTILMYSPGYFTSNDNSGFSVEGPLDNTIAAVNDILPDEWRVCDGSEFLDEKSSIWNVAGRYLPNLTDDRFIRGSSTAGAVGGSNDISLTQPQIPIHSHSLTISTEMAAHVHTVSTGAIYVPHGHPTGNSGWANATHRHPIIMGGLDDRNLSSQPGQYPVSDSYNAAWTGTYTNNNVTTHAHPSGGTAYKSVPHTHPVSVGTSTMTHSHSLGDVSNTGGNDTLGITPNYLSVFYITKVK